MQAEATTENKPLPVAQVCASVQPVMCGSCPFQTNGKHIHLTPECLANIMGYLIQGTPHICHHAQVTGSGPKRTCRGGRDYQLMVWHRLGMIEEPTDDALDAARAAHGFSPLPRCGKAVEEKAGANGQRFQPGPNDEAKTQNESGRKRE